MGASKIIKLRHLILIGAILVAFAPVFVSAASLTDLTELQKKRQAAIQQAAQKQKDAEAIQKIISQIDKDIKNTQYKINQTQNQINQTQNEINDVLTQIAQKEQELAIEQENQNEAIRVMYETTNQNTLEILIGSETLSEVVTYGEYLEALEIKIENTIAEIERLKKELEDKKTELEKKKGELEGLKTQLRGQLASLVDQKNQKNSLLNMTLAEKRQYLDEADKLKNDIARISADLYRQRLAAGGIITGGSGGYPFSEIDVPDPWLFLTRECTSYAAWYWNAILGKQWYNTQPGRGSATYWDEIAHTLGYTVSSTPQINAFVVWKSGPLTSSWGHVAIVEAVHNNGTIDVSEYNWVQYSYSYRPGINPAAYGTYVYIY
jgi:peptidoglycan hydrolase CwlO-like protein/surface antigen